MPVISKRFADELDEKKEMRDAYLEEKTRARIALQIKSIRSQRGWSQAELGQRMGKPQSNVARLEDREVARYTVTTLLDLASTYDCGVIVEFVPYEEFLQRTEDLSPERLQVLSFDRQRLEPLTNEAVAATTQFAFAYDVQQWKPGLAFFPETLKNWDAGSGVALAQPALSGLTFWAPALPVFPNDKLIAERDAARRERDDAISQRDSAIKERDRLRSERDFLQIQLVDQGTEFWTLSSGLTARPHPRIEVQAQAFATASP
jgi:transcriptional regulator with XRE-family HTH domain